MENLDIKLSRFHFWSIDNLKAFVRKPAGKQSTHRIRNKTVIVVDDDDDDVNIDNT